jgi:hypothetical protein
MDDKATGFKIGDVVKVKKGVLDPDTGAFSIGGWQGRIFDISAGEEEKTIIDIEWDSITLRNMPTESIEQCEEQGLDWTQMGLYSNELESAEARDTQKEVKEAQKEMEDTYSDSYLWLGEEGKRIGQILAGIDPDDEFASLERWEEYLEQHLCFPFEAVVDEYQERGALKAGDKASIKSISMVDEMYGIIVALRVGRKKYEYPLCEFAATDKQSSNYQLIQDYRVWFANR